jgi:hypothetical protein
MVDTLDNFCNPAHQSPHDRRTRTHLLHVFLGLPVTGGSTDHNVNKPPSGGFVVSRRLLLTAKEPEGSQR